MIRIWLCSFIFCLLVACQPSKPMPIYGKVPDFELTTETGNPFTRKQLDGKIWVADFIYTHCTGPCPLMTSRMRRVQASVQTMPEVRLVSFSVDPEHDTPAVLAAYARQFHAQPDRWFFLTGARRELQLLSRDAFKLSDITPDLTHSTRFVLVDQRSRIRGYYSTSDGSAIPDLIADIRRLAKEPS
jgi:protein SCO1/2